MVEERKAVLGRLRRLCEVATVEELRQVEEQLKSSIQSRGIVRNNKVQNPSGTKEGGPCRICFSPRPPQPGHAPWHLRSGKGGVLIGKSAVCAACVWSSRHKRPREEWPHWQDFSAGKWPKQMDASSRNFAGEK